MRKAGLLILLGGLAGGLLACSGNLGALPVTPVISPETGGSEQEVEFPDASPSTTPTASLTPALTRTLSPSPTPTPVPPTPTHTPSPTATPEPLVFAVIGDYGLAGPDSQAVAELVKGWSPAFILTTGDNNYPVGEAESIDRNIGQWYHEYIFPYRGRYGDGADRNRFFPILGNHDVDTAGGKAYFDYFELPGNERYYDFVWGPVHFFALNSDSREPDGVTASSRQAAWLQEGLAASQSPWKVVLMHVPPYSSGIHGSTDWMRWPFQEWGATLALSGHNHLYERLEVAGFPYIVNGLGGYLRYPFREVLPESQVRFNADYGALRVEATEEALTLQFITVGGVVVDTLELVPSR